MTEQTNVEVKFQITDRGHDQEPKTKEVLVPKGLTTLQALYKEYRKHGHDLTRKFTIKILSETFKGVCYSG